MTSHESFRKDLGSYVLGALDPRDRSMLEQHLGSCPACREELASLAGLPGLMSRVSPDEVVSDSLLPSPALLPRLLDSVEMERRADRGRLRRWRLAAATLAVTAASAVAVGQTPAATDAPAVALSTATGSLAEGTVSFEPRPWGTAVALSLHDLPPAASYIAWAVDRGGQRTAVATWGATSDGTVSVIGATPLAPTAVQDLTVETADGHDLLTLAD